MSARYQVGQLVTGYRFGPARIIAVRPFGTIDVQAVSNGRCYRVSGLPMQPTPTSSALLSVLA